MKKFYTVLFTLLLFLFFHQTKAQVVTFTFAGINGDEAAVVSNTQAPGVQPATISRGPGVTASPTGDRFNSRDWTTGTSPDMNDYVEFTITPQAGYSITITDITLQHQRSSTGPKSFVIRTSLDGFAANATNVVNIADVNTTQTSSFSFGSVITINSPITIRIYAYNAETTSGTWGPGQSVSGSNELVVNGSLMILPVKLVQVKAVLKNKQIEVSWVNLTESDLLYYSLEHAANGQSFTTLSKLDPLKNNGSEVAYIYTDTYPYSTTNFYRIKAVETTGRVFYSNVIKIEMGAGNTSLSLYPNPAIKSAQVAVQMNNMPAGKYALKVYSATAQLMYSYTVMVNGTLTETISLNNWQKGMYVLEISGPVKMQKQFIVQ